MSNGASCVSPLLRHLKSYTLSPSQLATPHGTKDGDGPCSQAFTIRSFHFADGPPKLLLCNHKRVLTMCIRVGGFGGWSGFVENSRPWKWKRFAEETYIHPIVNHWLRCRRTAGGPFFLSPRREYIMYMTCLLYTSPSPLDS